MEKEATYFTSTQTDNLKELAQYIYIFFSILFFIVNFYNVLIYSICWSNGWKFSGIGLSCGFSQVCSRQQQLYNHASVHHCLPPHYPQARLHIVQVMCSSAADITGVVSFLPKLWCDGQVALNFGCWFIIQLFLFLSLKGNLFWIYRAELLLLFKIP